jgi:hypothetical protein
VRDLQLTCVRNAVSMTILQRLTHCRSESRDSAAGKSRCNESTNDRRKTEHDERSSFYILNMQWEEVVAGVGECWVCFCRHLDTFPPTFQCRTFSVRQNRSIFFMTYSFSRVTMAAAE